MTSVTTDQVKEALRLDKGEEAQLHSWSIHDFDEVGSNFTAAVSCLKVKYSLKDKEESVNYIAKTEPNRGELWADFIRMVFETEIRFYKELGPALSNELIAIGKKELMIPRCLYGNFHTTETMILEDLRDSGYRMYDRKLSMDGPHISLVIPELARLHASSLLLMKKNAEPLQDRYDFLCTHWSNFKEGAAEAYQTITEGHMENALVILERIPGYEAAAKWLKTQKAKALEIFQDTTKPEPPFAVACHLDLVSNNFLFKYDEAGHPTDVIILDFQFTYLSSLATDLTEFFLVCLDNQDRSTSLQHFLKVYYDTFSDVIRAGGSTMPFTLEDMQREYKSKLLFGAIAAIAKIPFIIAETSEKPDMDNYSDDMFLNKQQKNMLTMYNKYPNFSSRFLSIFDELRQNGVF